LTAVSESASTGHVSVLGLAWGTTVGLALAHLFAFRLSARLVGSGTIGAHDSRISLAQLVGAAFVGVIATVPIVLMPPTSELDAARLLLAVFIGLVGYRVARSNDASRARSFVYAGSVLAIGVVIALLKNVLSGH
jgi:hypothetical protein